MIIFRLSLLFILSLTFSNCERKMRILDLSNNNDIVKKGTEKSNYSKTLKRIIGTKTIRFGTDATEAPWAFRDPKTNELTGYETELALFLTAKLSGYLNIKLRAEFINANWSDLPKELISDKIDVIANSWSPSDETKDTINWSDSYLDWKLMLAVREDSKARSITDIKDKIIGRYDDPTVMTIFKKFGIKEFKVFDNGLPAMKEVQSGKIGGFIYDSVFLKYFAKKNPGYKIIEDISDEVNSYNYGVRKKDKDLFELIDKAVIEMKKTKRYQSILANWFN